jgi:putative transposase
MQLPDGPNQLWSLDFVSDTLTCSRRFRILAIVHNYTRECPALVADTSLSSMRVARELTRRIGLHGKPHTVVSDNGTELTSSAILRWSQERRVEWHWAPARRMPQKDAVHVIGPCPVRARCLAARYNHVRPHSKLGGRTPAEIAGQRLWGHAPDTLPSPQPTIMKEPDSTSD